MKSAFFLVLLLLLVGATAEAQSCGRVNGTLAVPTITVAPGCGGGAAVSKVGPGHYKMVRPAGITSILVTALGNANSDFIAMVRRIDAVTVHVRIYKVGRACPPNVPIETNCLPANISRADSDFSFEIR